MSRLKDAWSVLRYGLPPARDRETAKQSNEKPAMKQEVIVVGDAVGELYRAQSKNYLAAVRNTMSSAFCWAGFGSYTGFVKPHWHGRYFRSCAAAFEAGGEDAQVTTVKALIVGDKAYILAGGSMVDIEPRPKVTKGRKRAGA